MTCPIATEVAAGNSVEISRGVLNDGVLQGLKRVADRLDVLLVRVARDEQKASVLDKPPEDRQAQPDELGAARPRQEFVGERIAVAHAPGRLQRISQDLALHEGHDAAAHHIGDGLWLGGAGIGGRTSLQQVEGLLHHV
jgi:hypothetical protein